MERIGYKPIAYTYYMYPTQRGMEWKGYKPTIYTILIAPWQPMGREELILHLLPLLYTFLSMETKGDGPIRATYDLINFPYSLTKMR